MVSVYLKCDSCGLEWSGDPYDHLGNYNENGYGYNFRNACHSLLRIEAQAKGWQTSEAHDMDFCPSCVKSGIKKPDTMAGLSGINGR